MNIEELQAKLPEWQAQLPELLITYGTKIFLAILVYYIGSWIAKGISGLVGRAMSARSVDPTVAGFVKNLLYYILYIVVVIAALGQLGVQTASFVAIVGAAGLAVGLALQGTLANFASGVLIMLFRPFKLGDYVEAGGASGAVKDIQIFATTILTPDNKTVTVANSQIMGDNITNYSRQTERRVDMVFGVGYGADLAKVKAVIQSVLAEDTRILKEPGVTIGVLELADSSVNFAVRPWVKTPDYWGVYFDTMEKMKVRFDQEGIEIPFPQMGIHVSKPE